MAVARDADTAGHKEKRTVSDMQSHTEAPGSKIGLRTTGTVTGSKGWIGHKTVSGAETSSNGSGYISRSSDEQRHIGASGSKDWLDNDTVAGAETGSAPGYISRSSVFDTKWCCSFQASTSVQEQ